MVGVAHFSGWTVTGHNCAWSCIEVTTIWLWPNMNWAPPPHRTLGLEVWSLFLRLTFWPIFSFIYSGIFFAEHNCRNHAQIRGKTSSSGLEWESGFALCSMPNQTLAWNLPHSRKIITQWFFSTVFQPKRSVQNKIHVLDMPIQSGSCVRCVNTCTFTWIIPVCSSLKLLFQSHYPLK